VLPIVLATYKPDPELLRLQLESLRAQSYQNWFVIVHDDQSMSLEALRAQVLEVLPADRALVVQGAERRGRSKFSAPPSNSCRAIANWSLFAIKTMSGRLRSSNGWFESSYLLK